MFWPLVLPLLQILVFTWVFHGLMALRWPARVGEASALDYGLNAFAGLVVFGFFAEVLSRSPASILSHPNLITKIRFPLPLLPVTVCLVGLVQAGVGLLLLMVVASLLDLAHGPSFGWFLLTLPIMMVYGLALALSLSALGLYVRDIAQAMPAMLGLLMFLSPIFFPASVFPAAAADWVMLNPIALGAEWLRAALLSGPAPAPYWILVHLALSLSFFGLAVGLFKRLERGFADVL